MAQKLLIATGNPHKVEKIKQMFNGNNKNFEFLTLNNVNNLKIEENKDTFEKNAIHKAVEYSKIFDGLVVATDGGVIIPSLPEWNPLYTKRFAGKKATDEDRILKILEMMRGKTRLERVMYWQEAIALCRGGKRLFSVAVKGIEGVMGHHFDPKKYRHGIWLCSVWEFPQFGGKNFFDLSTAEQLEVEISWTKLGDALHDYLVEHNLISTGEK